MVQIFGNKNFQELKEEDIRGLIARREEESVILEFKRKLSSNSKETAKDLSAMANTEGGVIIFGLNEDDDGKAKSIEYINSSDKFEEKIENIIATTINPQISFKIFPIQKKDDNTKFTYVILIPRSDNLHMVIKNGDNRYYKRSGKSVQKMEDSEIKGKVRLIELNKENVDALLTSLRLNFQELTGTSLSSNHCINYFVIPNLLNNKVQTILQLKKTVDDIKNNFSEGLNFHSYKSTISNSFYSNNCKWQKVTIVHKNGIIEFRRSHDFAKTFASSAETEKLTKIIAYTNEFYKKINYFGGYKIYLEIGNLRQYAFGKTFGNTTGLYSHQVSELNEFIEIEPLLTQETERNNLKILELMKMIGGVVGVSDEGAYENIKSVLNLQLE